MLTLAAMVALSAAPAGAARGQQDPNPGTPGVYVSEFTAFGDGVVALPTGVPVFVGVTGAPAGAPRLVSATSVGQALPAPSPALVAAVAAFFANGGAQAFVAPTADEQPGTLTAAVGTAVQQATGADLVAVPALAGLGGDAWVGVAAALGNAAADAQRLALVDPPAALAVQANTTDDPSALVALAGQLAAAVPQPRASVMLSADLVATDGGGVVPASGVVAGLLAANDVAEGVWDPVGLGSPIVGATPAWSPPNVVVGTLQDAGVISFRDLLTGGALFGDRTLQDDTAYPQVRLLDWVERSIRNYLQQFVFAANDATTWATVQAGISNWLTTLFAEGALVGTTASDALDVQVGLGTTMTGKDLLDGDMVVQVTVDPGPIGVPVPLTFTQTMGS